jgi:enamine deaminase RidA (YjgF/YER057c/UK114 family)
MSTERQPVPTAARWAPIVGYSRAVRVGNVVHVAGTAAVAPDGGIACPGDPYGQAQRCLEIIVAALREAGAGPEHVVRTRLYVTDAAFWQPVGQAHGEVFADVRPVTTLVVVAGFIDPAILVEIEAEAIL